MATRQSALSRALDNRTTLGLLFMVPAAGLLLVFLTYPLGLGTWLGFTDAKIGRSGEWVGIENFIYLWGDEVMRLAVFNTIFYTVVASVIKFGLGLHVAGHGAVGAVPDLPARAGDVARLHRREDRP